jgi:tetratricopeptide (TPR) repeat protein
MEQKLDFSLPDRKPEGIFSSRLTAMLLLVLILVGLANIVIVFWLPKSRPVHSSQAEAFTADQIKDLANKLSQRNLYDQAAKAWQEYLDRADLVTDERAKALFQVGSNLEKAGRYADAIEAFYRCEITAKADELASQINGHMKDCFERLGRFSALRQELMARTSYKAQEDTAAKVVAEIGPEKIIEADLSAAIENVIDTQLAPITPFMTSEQLGQERQRMLEEYKTATSRQQFLQTWLAQEMLYRQALDQGMPQQEKTKRVLDDVTRQVLAQRMMNEVLSSRIHLTDGDLQNFYDAHKDRFMEKAKDPNQPDRQKSFDEARQEVLQTLASQKSQEVQKTYIKEMMDKYQVVIHTAAFEEKK